MIRSFGMPWSPSNDRRFSTEFQTSPHTPLKATAPPTPDIESILSPGSVRVRLRCVECYQEIDTVRDVQFHAERTGHGRFEPITTPTTHIETLSIPAFQNLAVDAAAHSTGAEPSDAPNCASEAETDTDTETDNNSLINSNHPEEGDVISTPPRMIFLDSAMSTRNSLTSPGSTLVDSTPPYEPPVLPPDSELDKLVLVNEIFRLERQVDKLEEDANLHSISESSLHQEMEVGYETFLLLQFPPKKNNRQRKFTAENST